MKRSVRFTFLKGPSIRLLLLFIFRVALSGTPAAVSCPVRADSLNLSKKNILAIRTTVAPRIDGRPDDNVWKLAPVAGEFIEYGPRNGTLPVMPTEIRFLYDDVALYILAIMYDPHADSAMRELGRRDQLESLSNDYISFDIIPYNDGLNMYEFKVSPANVQHDCKYSAVGPDISWDAVWETATLTTDSAWIAEVKIPYSALRFPKVDKQVWGINMWRNNFRYHEYDTWSWVDNKSDNVLRYYGTISGIDQIKPPVRLSFSPYVAGYVEKLPEKEQWSEYMRGGLDLRYGINESYTLDMMLIPDFGQVQSDDQVLNLSPFEIRYDEKRQFFTEATELFNKCEVFYTRRVGSTPKNYEAAYDSLRTGEVVDKNPDQTKIINATKVSGRNAKGFAVGVFNGMTTNTWATVRDTVSGVSRKVMTQPFTNYNVLVFDKNLKNDSYITLINTNYWTPESRYAANVTGAETQLKNRSNTFSFFGRFNVSQIFRETEPPSFGHQYLVGISKPSGKFQFELARQETGNTYDPNDMGFLLYNNEVANSLELYWKEVDPFWIIVRSTTSLEFEYLTLYRPNSFKTLDISISNSTTYLNYLTSSFDLGIQPLGYDDYYEPRVWGYVYKRPWNYYDSWYVSSDPGKPFQYRHNFFFNFAPDDQHVNWNFGLTPRVRINNHMSVTLNMQYEKDLNNRGWVETMYPGGEEPPVILFGRRDISTISNVLNASYIFTTKTSLSLRVRHYWSQAKYLSFYTLNPNGTLTETGFQEGNDINFNAFTADLQFVWYFAPGSELSLVWKNVINTWGQKLEANYWDDLTRMLDSPQSNSISLRVLYYLDYQQLKKLFEK